jgi:hypothetical protein
MEERERNIRKYRQRMFQNIVDNLNIREDREMMNIAEEAAKKAPLGEEFGYSVLVALAGNGCIPAKQRLEAEARSGAGRLMSPESGDPDYTRLDVTGRNNFWWGFWRRRKKEGD